MSARLVLYLASSSPRRRELLAQLGLYPETVTIEIDESLRQGESAHVHAERLALAKAGAGFQALGKDNALVLGADTVVSVGEVLLGKPRDRGEALRMLGLLSGRQHEVITSVALSDAHAETVVTSVTTVTMRKIARQEMLDYWDTGEPCDKAGGYGIQGLGAMFVSAVNGSYSGVVGLPLFETAQLLLARGVTILNKRVASQ